MKERTKETVKDGFASLVNNAAALRGAKNGPLWLTIVMFVLSLLLPVIPLFVNQAKTNGSSFLGSKSYSLEKYVTSVALDLKSRNIEFGIDNDHLLTVSDNGNPVEDWSTYEANTAFASYTDSVTNDFDFMVYLSAASTTKEQNAVNKALLSKYYADETGAGYIPSYMILFKNTVYVNVMYASKSVTSSLGGDYKSFKPQENCLDTLLSVTNKDGAAVERKMSSREYVDGVYANFKKFLDKSYTSLKVKNTLTVSGIYLAIFFGMSVVMGFLMWILTRGKNNPNNYFSPWLTQKVEARLALSPAIITLIVGFFLTQYAPFIFIMTLGLRVMWISMKELRPMQQ